VKRVLICDDSLQVRRTLSNILSLEGMEVVGEVGTAEEALTLARQLRPDVVLMDINLPGMDGLSATASLAREGFAVVIISVEGEREYLRRAMQAGARDYLIKPFTAEQLVQAISRQESGAVLEAGPKGSAEGTLITLAGLKGGVGKSLLCLNLAAALALAFPSRKVVAVDLNLEGGVLATLAGLRPSTSIADLRRARREITPEEVREALLPLGHPPFGILAAPPSPSLAVEIDGEGKADPHRNYVDEVLQALLQSHDFVVADTPAQLREATLAALDRATFILLVTVPEVTALDVTRRTLEVFTRDLGYPEAKIRLVLNRVGYGLGVSSKEVEKTLNFRISYVIPEDRSLAFSGNLGKVYFTLRGKGPARQAIARLAQELAREAKKAEVAV
jgi:pilus assembly protein CpaE